MMNGIFKYSLSGLGIIGPDGIFIDANPALCQLLGVRKPTLLKRPAISIVSDDDTERFKRLLRVKKPRQRPLQIKVQTQSGQTVPCLSTIVEVQPCAPAGVQLLLQVQALAADDTATLNTKTEIKAQQSEDLTAQACLGSFVNNYPGIVYRCSFAQQRILEYASEGSKCLAGYSPAELKKFKTFDTALIHPTDLVNVQEQLRLSFVRETPYNIIYRMVRKDGIKIWVRDQGQGVFVNDELVACEGFIHDITDTHRLGLRFAHQATHDELTGLANRRQFEQHIERALAHAKVYGHIHTLCYVDLDQFKLINDSVGHRAGDELLKHVAVLMRSKARDSDVIARLGGDEFGILLNHCPLERGRHIADKMVREIGDIRFPWEDSLFQVGMSIGLIEINPQSESVSSLMSCADVACYAAKDLGRSRVHMYEEKDVELLKRHSEILHVSGLRDALENEQFILYCQPIKQLSGTVGQLKSAKHYEVLLRLSEPNGQIILPGAFIPAAEKYGLMGAIDRWVIRKVISSYDFYFKDDRDIQFAVNLSGKSLSEPGLLNYIRDLIHHSNILPGQLCFEITETAAVQNLQHAAEFIKQGRELGCLFALDDFGSGLSSFAYLKYFPVHYLKIDGGFVCDMVNDHNDRVLVAAINEIGHIMGMQTIAEWVETDEVLDSLRALEVDYVQGSAIGKPIPLDRSVVIGL